MKLFVYLPVALHPDPRSALLISYGVGSTAKALTDTAGLETIDVVDTSRDVLEMNRIVYPDPGSLPLADPRVRVHIEDGRFFLQTTSKRFDIITGEPPPPKHAGIVNLYTREYFALVRDRLREGGIATYWLPVHALTESDSKAILRAFCDVFEDCTLWDGSPLNWIMMGTRDARGPVSQRTLHAAVARPGGGDRSSRRWVWSGRSSWARCSWPAPTTCATSRPGPRLWTTTIRSDCPRSSTDPTEMVEVYRPWMESQRRAASASSAARACDRLWPPSLRQDSLGWFAWQALRIGRSSPSSASRPQRLPELHRILTTRRCGRRRSGFSAPTPTSWRPRGRPGRRAGAASSSPTSSAPPLSLTATGSPPRSTSARRRKARRTASWSTTGCTRSPWPDVWTRRGAWPPQAGLPRPGLAGDQVFVRFASDALGLELPGG